MKKIIPIIISLIMVSCYSPTAKLEKERSKLMATISELTEKENVHLDELARIENRFADLVKEASKIDFEKLRSMEGLLKGALTGSYNGIDIMQSVDTLNNGSEKDHEMIKQAADMEVDLLATKRDLKLVKFSIKKAKRNLKVVEKKIELIEKY